ncbi:MAG: HAMP domain-containing protein [Thermodesulfobacteriota bacterium]
MFSPQGNIGPSGKKERFWEISSGLHKKTLIFFALLILLASVLSGVAIYHHNKGEAALNTIAAMNEGENTPAAQREVEARKHVGLEDSLTIMTVALVSVLIIFMFFFIRNIIQPLSKLQEMTREMADGRLDLLVQDSKTASCSIGTIGENVNSLAMNLQEVLLLVWNLSEHNLGTVDQTLKALEGDGKIPREQIRSDLQSLKAELQQMQNLTQQFELFDVTLDGKKALAKEETTKS